MPFRLFLDITLLPSNTTEYIKGLSLASFRDTVFSEPWLHAKIYRDATTFSSLPLVGQPITLCML